MMIIRSHGGDIYSIELKEKMGEGAFGEVYKAISNKSGKERVITVKIFDSDSCYNEADITIPSQANKNCNCLNLLCLLDYGTTTYNGNYKCVAITRHLQDAKSLRECLDEKITEKWSNCKLLHMMLGMVNGVQHLTEQNILHLDIKPANILVKGNEYPIIIDYGLACMAQDCPIGGQGTPLYSAPEGLTRRGYNNRSDVFSLGCVFFELLCGKLTFTTEEAKQYVPEFENYLRRNDKIYESLKVLITNMLNPNHLLRVSIQEVGSALRKMLDEAPCDEMKYNDSSCILL